MTDLIQHHSVHFRLTAAQCNAQRELSPTCLVQHLIETATEHADLLGIGYRRLQEDGLSWVLSRLAFEMKRYPGLLEEYTITTWVEDYNRRFSLRNFRITGTDGEVLGYARSVWMAIDIRSRRPGMLPDIDAMKTILTDRECPISPPDKIAPVDNPDITNTYSFHVSDIDFNRHVNSTRYVDLMINQLPLEVYDLNFVARMDIAFKQEAHFGDTVDTISNYSMPWIRSAICRDGAPLCLSMITLRERLSAPVIK